MAQCERNSIEQFTTELMGLGEAEFQSPNRVLVTVIPEKLVEAAHITKSKLGFDHPVCAGAVDYQQEKRIEVTYYALSSSTKMLLMLRVNVPRESPVISSLTSVWEAMEYHERETWEMFGVEFKGHSNLSRFLLPEDWPGGFPLRKDFKPVS